MIDNILRIIIVGPTGAGKSRYCNFCLRDESNSINKVSDSLDSCTQDPKSNVFNRLGKNFDFIDTAGNSDSNDNDIENLKRLVNYLEKLKKIHYIILVLKFGERLTGDTKQYIEALGKIFTVREFFCHLCIVFTKFPTNPTEEDLRTKNVFNLEINKLLKKVFNPTEIDNLPDNEIYYINTVFAQENKDYNKKNQEIVDKILKKIISTQELHNPINTENLDITGKNAKLRRELELEMLRKKIEEEKRRREIAEYEAREARIREEGYRMAYEQERRAKKEIDDLKNEIIKKEQENKDNIKNEKKKSLDSLSSFGSDLVHVGAVSTLGAVGLGLLGAVLTPVCPVIGPTIIAAAFGGGATGAAETVVGGTIYGVAESKKKDL